MSRWTRVAIYLLLAAIGIAGWRYLIYSEPLRFGANAVPEQQTAGVMVYGYAVTLLGVVLGSAYRELQSRRQRGDTRLTSAKEFAGSVFLSLDFWMSLCGSPLVFALLWKSMEGGSVAGLSTIALQNGFCCTVIVSSLMAKPQQPPAPVTPRTD